MNWEMISAVGQMLGAVGVIISIIYLAAQIRNQNKESRHAATNVLTTHWSDVYRIPNVVGYTKTLAHRRILRAN